MADYTAINQSPVISGASAQVDQVFLTGVGGKALLEVLNVDGGGRISFRVDGTAAVQDAAENYCVPAAIGQGVQVIPGVLKGKQAYVSVICSATMKYQVSLVPAP